MKPDSEKHILVIGHQADWLSGTSEALRKEGFTVDDRSSYEYPPTADDGMPEDVPDLVILGCTNIRDGEQQLIERILARKHHLLVLCTTLSAEVMRSLFLGGASDVAGNTYDPTRLVGVVKQTLETIKPSSSSQHRNSKGAE